MKLTKDCPDPTQIAGAAPTRVAGLIAVAGRPLSGRHLLARRVSERLENARAVAVASMEEKGILRGLRAELDDDTGTLVVSAPLVDHEARRRLRELAHELGARLLVVEVDGLRPRSIERIARHASIRELAYQLWCARAAAAVGEPPPGREPVPAMTVSATDPLAHQVEDVLTHWSNGRES